MPAKPKSRPVNIAELRADEADIADLTQPHPNDAPSRSYKHGSDRPDHRRENYGGGPPDNDSQWRHSRGPPRQRPPMGGDRDRPSTMMRRGGDEDTGEGNWRSADPRAGPRPTPPSHSTAIETSSTPVKAAPAVPADHKKRFKALLQHTAAPTVTGAVKEAAPETATATAAPPAKETSKETTTVPPKETSKETTTVPPKETPKETAAKETTNAPVKETTTAPVKETTSTSVKETTSAPVKNIPVAAQTVTTEPIKEPKATEEEWSTVGAAKKVTPSVPEARKPSAAPPPKAIPSRWDLRTDEPKPRRGDAQFDYRQSDGRDGRDFRQSDGRDFRQSDGRDFRQSDGRDFRQSDGRDFRQSDGRDFRQSDNRDFRQSDMRTSQSKSLAESKSLQPSDVRNDVKPDDQIPAKPDFKPAEGIVLAPKVMGKGRIVRNLADLPKQPKAASVPAAKVEVVKEKKVRKVNERKEALRQARAQGLKNKVLIAMPDYLAGDNDEIARLVESLKPVITGQKEELITRLETVQEDSSAPLAILFALIADEIMQAMDNLVTAGTVTEETTNSRLEEIVDANIYPLAQTLAARATPILASLRQSMPYGDKFSLVAMQEMMRIVAKCGCPRLTPSQTLAELLLMVFRDTAIETSAIMSWFDNNEDETEGRVDAVTAVGRLVEALRGNLVSESSEESEEEDVEEEDEYF